MGYNHNLSHKSKSQSKIAHFEQGYSFFLPLQILQQLTIWYTAFFLQRKKYLQLHLDGVLKKLEKICIYTRKFHSLNSHIQDSRLCLLFLMVRCEYVCTKNNDISATSHFFHVLCLHNWKKKKITR